MAAPAQPGCFCWAHSEGAPRFPRQQHPAASRSAALHQLPAQACRPPQPTRPAAGLSGRLRLGPPAPAQAAARQSAAHPQESPASQHIWLPGPPVLFRPIASAVRRAICRACWAHRRACSRALCCFKEASSCSGPRKLPKGLNASSAPASCSAALRTSAALSAKRPAATQSPKCHGAPRCGLTAGCACVRSTAAACTARQECCPTAEGANAVLHRLVQECAQRAGMLCTLTRSPTARRATACQCPRGMALLCASVAHACRQRARVYALWSRPRSSSVPSSASLVRSLACSPANNHD